MFENPEELFKNIFALSLGISVGIITVFILLSWLLNIVSLMLGVKLAGVKNRGFGKAFLATMLIVFFGGFVVALLTTFNPLLGLLGLLIVPSIFIQWVYSCSFSKACGAYILSFFANIAFFIAILVTLPLAINICADKINKSDSKDKPKTEKVEDNSTKIELPNTDSSNKALPNAKVDK